MTSRPGSIDRLAIDGGAPVVPDNRIMTSRWPRIHAEDVDAIVNQIRTGLLTEMSNLQQVHEFEAEMAVFTGTRYAMTVNSGTAALHAAVAGLNIEPGDEGRVPADRKSTRLNSSHTDISRMPSSA